jgi:GTP-binding protein
MARSLVAVVGRPNVGKSTLFNRLVGDRVAIVEDEPGTTRDRLYATAEWRGREFTLVDTGGLVDPGGPRPAREPPQDLEESVRRQAEAAIDEADVVLFVVDAQAGIIPVEHDVADRLRRSRKPVVLAANKTDSWRSEAQAAEFYSLGLGDLHTVSAIQGTGTGDLLDAIVSRLPKEQRDPETEGAWGPAPTTSRIAILGRPNVGKSSFLNALAKEERAVVSARPGTTRDTVDTVIERDGRRIVLVDTAGIRRRGRIDEGIEKFALLRTVRALERADVAILLTDATEGIAAQDVHIAGYALEAYVGLVLAVNKWDLVDRGAETTAAVERDIAREFHFAPWLGHRFVSAKTGRGVEEALVDAVAVSDERRKRISTSDLHKLLVEAVAAHPPPTDKGREVRFHHVTQAKGPAPTFVFFVDRPAAVHFSYARYLENEIRRRFGFNGTPLRLELRGARE